MRSRTMLAVLTTIASLVLPVLAQRREPPPPNPPPNAMPPQMRGGGRQVTGTAARIQMRSYDFKDANQKMEYAVFVSARINRRDKSPLVIALHGQGVQPVGMMRYLTDAADANGYIVAAPMGYSLDGWYGIDTPPPTGARTPGIAELSEKDVMNVLALMRQEFNIDDHRIYLLGQSMGGAGALHLGIKYHQIWAAVAASAPAAGALRPSMLESVTDLPMMLVHGDADETVPVARTRAWAEKMGELKMTYEYYEIRGVGHSDAIAQGAPRIFAFFNKHSKQH